MLREGGWTSSVVLMAFGMYCTRVKNLQGKVQGYLQESRGACSARALAIHLHPHLRGVDRSKGIGSGERWTGPQGACTEARRKRTRAAETKAPGSTISTTPVSITPTARGWHDRHWLLRRMRTWRSSSELYGSGAPPWHVVREAAFGRLRGFCRFVRSVGESCVRGFPQGVLRVWCGGVGAGSVNTPLGRAVPPGRAG